MNYTHKDDVRDKRMRGCHNMRGRLDNVVVIVDVVRLSQTSSVRSAYSSHRPVNLSLPTLLRLADEAEVEYRTVCCTMTGTRPSQLFLTLFPPSP